MKATASRWFDSRAQAGLVLAASLAWGAHGCGSGGAGGSLGPSTTKYSCQISCASGSSLLELCADYGAISLPAAKEQCRKETCGNGMHVQGSNSVSPQTCDYKPCGNGRVDCDGDPDNGCEAELSNDPDNCGACGNVCPKPMGDTLGESVCVMGACKLGCPDIEECCARKTGTEQQDCYSVARQGSSSLCYQWRQYICTPVQGGPVIGTGGASGGIAVLSSAPSRPVGGAGGKPTTPVAGGLAGSMTPLPSGGRSIPGGTGGITGTSAPWPTPVGGAITPASLLPPIAGATDSGGAMVGSAGVASGGATPGPLAGVVGGNTRGAAGAGGTTGGLPGNSAVTFNNGQGVGIMTGYAWVAPSAAVTITEPLCQGQPITQSQVCLAPSWSPANALCVSGSIPALPPSPTGTDYVNNWGMTFGVNVDAVEGGLGRSWKSIAFMISGAPQSGLLATVIKQGDELSYLAPLTPGVPIPFTQFARDYYEPSPKTFLPAADVPRITRIGIQVPSANQPITIAKLCLQMLVFAD